jgi:hypothetical protein
MAWDGNTNAETTVLNPLEPVKCAEGAKPEPKDRYKQKEQGPFRNPAPP